MKRLLIIAALSACTSFPSYAEVEAGYRLFTTSVQRSSLDGLRSGQVAEAASAQVAAPRKVDKLTYSGYYVSPQGEMRYWLNGEDAGRVEADDVRVLNVKSSGVMTLYRIEKDQHIRMRAGQSLTLDENSRVETHKKAEPAQEPLDESSS